MKAPMNQVVRTEASAIRNVCVYCGSADAVDPTYVAAAAQLGELLADAGMRLVYGGGSNGLMGAVAHAVIDNGGSVTGIIPEFLKNRELMLKSAQDLVVVPDMHTRKRLMFERADAFIALPGGIGTLEELFEIWTWAQLGLHGKPCGLLDSDGFFGPLVTFLDRLVVSGFVQPQYRAILQTAETPEDLLAAFAAYQAPLLARWVGPGQT